MLCWQTLQFSEGVNLHYSTYPLKWSFAKMIAGAQKSLYNFWNENDRQNDRGTFVKSSKIWQKWSIFVDYYLWFFNKNACFSTKSKDNDMQFLLENHRFSAIFECYYLSNLLKICWFWLILIDFVVLKARTRNEFENDHSPKWSLRENFAQKVENHQKWSIILVDKYCSVISRPQWITLIPFVGHTG